jgi:hypothetical protein
MDLKGATENKSNIWSTCQLDPTYSPPPRGLNKPLWGLIAPSSSWYASCNWWRFRYLVVPLWHASFGLSAWLDFGPCTLFLFLSLIWVLSFYEIWPGFHHLRKLKDPYELAPTWIFPPWAQGFSLHVLLCVLISRTKRKCTRNVQELCL